MPMYNPTFTTSESRIARLQENYAEGVQRERMPTLDRERRDQHCLHVTNEKLLFLFQNAMESYSPAVKNQKVKEYNEVYISTAPVPNKEARKSRFRFL